MKSGAFLVSILLFLLLAPQAYATQAAQAPASPEAVQIDQIFKENRALLSQGRFDEIPPKAEAALALAQKLGDKARQSRALSQIATAAFHNGDKDKALTHFKLAVGLAAQAGDHNLQSLSLLSAAVLLTSSGLYEEAYYFYSQARALRQQLKDRQGEAHVLSGMVALFMDTDQLDEAERLLQEAWQLTQQLRAEGKGNESLEDLILFRFSGLEVQRNRPAFALQYLQQLLAKETEKTYGGMRLEMRDRLGEIYSLMGEYSKAEAAYADTAQLARKLKSVAFEGRALGGLAKTQYRLGKPQEALPLIVEALALVRANGNEMAAWSFQYYLAEIQRTLGRNEEALTNFRAAIKANEYLRLRSIPSEESKGAIVANGRRIYASTIELLFELKRTEEALEIAEAWHARAFLDVLTESRIDLRLDLSPAQKTREDKLLENISRIQKELWAAKLSPEQRPKLQAELQQAEADLAAYQLEIRHGNPRYANVKYLQPLKPANIAKEILSADTALIEFVLGEQRSFAWIIQTGKITAVTLPPEKEISALLAEYRATLTEKISSLNATNAINKSKLIGRQLYQLLLQPLEPQLNTVSKLIIVPDGALLYLPFETLVRDKAAKNTEYLLERFAISYAPSASALAALKTSATDQAVNKGLLAFGDPVYSAEKLQEKTTTFALNAARTFDLRNVPYTRREVSDIAALFPRTEQQTFLGTEAHEQNVKAARLDQYRYVHFAAHGIIDETRPARSGIVLSSKTNSKEDGVLQMSEVMRLKLNAELVTLSACRTGLGKLLNGEGMIGLTRAFFYAGAESVVVSLWNVNDIATASLMKTFYQNLQQGKSKDEALRQAKLTLLKGQQRAWRHPYYWAAFVLAGERQ